MPRPGRESRSQPGVAVPHRLSPVSALPGNEGHEDDDEEGDQDEQGGVDPVLCSSIAGNLYVRIVFTQCRHEWKRGLVVGLISAPEAAVQLGVSRTRIQQRIQDGSLPARKVGRQWVIDQADLREIAHHTDPGRPLSRASAGALIAVAADVADHLSPWAKSRARARLARLLEEAPHERDLDDFAVLMLRTLGHRAARELYRASPLDLAGLRDDARMHLSGLSSPKAEMSALDVVEGYSRAGDRDALVRDHLLVPASADRANVVLHVVDEAVDPERYKDIDLVIAADLAEHPGPRERARAQELLAERAQRRGA